MQEMAEAERMAAIDQARQALVNSLSLVFSKAAFQISDFFLLYSKALS